MSSSEFNEPAKNVVAIFHASFHPTKGNVIDWSLKSYEGLNLDGVEFSVLPSGLHLVERDIVYFTHGPHSGVALFRRRPTRTQGHRGFRLSSFGILLQDSPHPRPWLHLDSLRTLTDSIYAAADRKEEDVDLLHLNSESGSISQPIVSEGELTEDDLAPAREWFERRKAPRPSSLQTWNGWSDELDGTFISERTPTHHLPHLLRILGLSSLTLYKFILSRRRIMIFTLPPVEVAGTLAWIAADLCRERHASPKSRSFGVPMEDLFAPGGDKESEDQVPESVRVLGMVTLSDLSRLEAESAKGRGWIACTTDAIFLEKPQYYDLIIDLTTSTPSKASRPTLYMSKPVPPSSNGKRKAGYKLETVRFTWSDVKLWTELDRILKLDSAQSATHSHGAHSHRLDIPCSNSGPVPGLSRWTDVFQLYEDVCLLCATLWMGLGTWRSNSRASFSSSPPVPGGKSKATEWGSVRLEGDDDWSMNGTHMRTLGQGIEGGKKAGQEVEIARMRTLGKGIEGRPKGPGGRSRPIDSQPKGTRKASTSSASQALLGTATATEEEDSLSADEREELRQPNLQTTLALLQTFHANTVFWLSKLHEIIPPPSTGSSPAPGLTTFLSENADSDVDTEIIVISSRDLLTLELGVLSELDAKFVEWLAEAEGYTGRNTGRKLVVKRGWQELFGILLGLR